VRVQVADDAPCEEERGHGGVPIEGRREADEKAFGQTREGGEGGVVKG
jgi:hypothetical protein